MYFSTHALDKAPLKGDLEHVEINSLPIQVSDEREVYNNWKPFTEDELKLGPNGDLSEEYRRKAVLGSEGAFDKVNFEDEGYRLLGTP